ncbi:ROK family protein [Pedobacter immunditicola]|uniref:ROK family protein n=1 Tax=Pedobacter immunditicola TaxID=3133440 RepID=UPI0030B6F613
MNDYVLGIDIGGSHITAALVNMKTRSIVPASFQRSGVNSNNPAEEILASWCEVIKATYQTFEVKTKQIGIAMPGPFDYEAGISLIQDQDKFRSLYQMNIKNELALRLNIEAENIRFVNDAAGFLQGEVFSGAAREGNRVIGLTLGTGLGSAFCDNGVAEDAALWQSPFKDGIAEDYLSTRWFVTRYFQLTGRKIAGVKEINVAGNEASYQQIFEEFGHHLADFLIPLVKERMADTVVLGGNISNAHAAFLPCLQKKFQEQDVVVNLKIAALQENAALIGAASCWEFYRHS